jgi:tripartite motif-containing protein 71
MKIKNAVVAGLMSLGLGVFFAPVAIADPLYTYQYSIGQGVLNNPFGVTVDPSGNVFVADQGNNRIAKFSSSGTFVSSFGSAGSGDGQFSFAYGVTSDKFGNVFVADTGNNRIQKFSNSGSFLTSFGNALLNSPVQLTTDSDGDVWVADSGSNKIRQFSNSGTLLSSLGVPGTGWNGSGAGDGQLNRPTGVAFDSSGNVWVADEFNNRIQEFSQDGTFLSTFGSFGSGNDQLHHPIGIAIDSFDRVLVTDNNNYTAKAFSKDGTFLEAFAPGCCVTGITLDAGGKLYVVDRSQGLSVYAPTAPVPEPETYAMMLAGLGLLAVFAHRRKQEG